MKAQRTSYRGLTSIAQKPVGGYCLISVRSLLAVWYAFAEGDITLFDLRSWLASHELLARRCQIGKNRIPKYTARELGTLIGSNQANKAKHAICRLIAAGLMQRDTDKLSMDTQAAEQRFVNQGPWIDGLALVKNNNRMVPVPRRTIRFLAKSRSKTLIGTGLGHLIRALYISKERCFSGGRCKVSWIVAVFRLDTRNVKLARKKLLEVGWIQAVESPQLALNRWGLQVVINLQWCQSGRKSETPPPKAHITTKTPLPIYDKKLSNEISINQKPSRSSSGIKEQTIQAKAPTLKHITSSDLTDPKRLDVLFHQAVDNRILTDTYCSRLKWFSAAEHAVKQAKRNPGGFFAVIVTKRLWHHVSHREEDIAQAKLKLLDFGEDSVLLQTKQASPFWTQAKAA